MDRNLALEFVRVTEAAAISCAEWFGKGDKIAADQAAVDSMRERFNYVDFKGEVVIGEGDKDEAPLLYIGEKIGTGNGPEMDIAVDPLEGTSLTAKGKPNAISVLASGPKGTLLKAPGTYMDQIAVGPRAKGVIDITKSVKDNVKAVANALNKDIKETTVVVMDRDRHKKLINDLRKVGCRIAFIEHGSVTAGLAPGFTDSGIDMMISICGSPEGVITAAGLKCLGGDFQGILKPHNKEFEKQAVDMGFTDLDKVFTIDELAKGDRVSFAATGVSDGPFLRGVHYTSYGAVTESLVMRAKSGTVRFIETYHHLGKERKGFARRRM